MTEDEARKVELVRAVELEDGEAVLLTREDRQQADGHARSREPVIEGRASEQQRFIARRAEFAAARLTTRHPGIAELLGRTGWPRWVGWAVPLVSLVAGFLANEFGTGKRLDLLAVPLLGTIAWNLLVYLGLVVAAASGKGAAAGNPILRLVARFGGTANRHFDRGTPLNRAANAFQQRWSERSATLNGARIARTLHLAAALFAGGLIAGIYLRALVIEYRAGWESTFLQPEAVHALLSAVLGPASLATGVAIPPVAEIAAMRWNGAAGGVNAGPWIHLYTATVVGLVIAPRLLLAIWQGARALHLTRNLPTPGREDFYIRRLLRAGGAKRGAARVTPYAYRPGEETRRRLGELLRRALGDGAEIRFDDPIEYGAEDRWLATDALDPADDYHILLFTLSATPEAENHGALAAALTRRIADEHPGTVPAALIDESPFRTHFAGQSGLEERIGVRLATWRRVLSDAQLTAVPVDLSSEVDEALAQRIEAGLLADGTMRR